MALFNFSYDADAERRRREEQRLQAQAQARQQALYTQVPEIGAGDQPMTEQQFMDFQGGLLAPNQTPEQRQRAFGEYAAGMVGTPLEQSLTTGLLAQQGFTTGAEPAAVREFKYLQSQFPGKKFTYEDYLNMKRQNMSIQDIAGAKVLQSLLPGGQSIILSGAEKEREAAAKLKEAETRAGKSEERRQKWFDESAKIYQNLDEQQNKMLEAARLVEEEGANTGPIWDLLPSFTSATKQLDVLRDELGLNVIKGVTLGAISEKELELVRRVGLPKGLKGPALAKYVKDKAEAIGKYKSIILDQVNWLKANPGKDSLDYWTMKEKERQQAPAAQPQQMPAATPTGETYEQRRKRLLGL